MSAGDVLALARSALLPLGVPVVLNRAEAPEPSPESYIVLDHISGTPVSTFDLARSPKRRLIQVTCWARTYDAASTLTGQAAELLITAGLREGQDRNAPADDDYVGLQTDWRHR